MTKFPSKLLQKQNLWNHCKSFSWQICIVLLLCFISYRWLDRPLAVLMLHLHYAGELGSYGLTNKLTAFAYFCVLLTMIFYVYMRIFRHVSTHLVATAGSISLAAPIAFFVKTQLQYFFGRISPRYDNSEALLFLKHPNLYGFHLLGGGSFPSGHMCVFTAVFLMISFYYPKLKPLCVLALFILAFLLLFYNYHFLSDVIAGTYLGYFIAKVIHEVQSDQVKI